MSGCHWSCPSSVVNPESLVTSMKSCVIDELRRATGPRHLGQIIDELADEYLITEIERLRREALDYYFDVLFPSRHTRAELAAFLDRHFSDNTDPRRPEFLSTLQSFSGEGWGDGAVRVVANYDLPRWMSYSDLWWEFTQRPRCHEPRADGGWRGLAGVPQWSALTARRLRSRTRTGTGQFEKPGSETRD
jgi:hypothetical protein